MKLPNKGGSYVVEKGKPRRVEATEDPAEKPARKPRRSRSAHSSAASKEKDET